MPKKLFGGKCVCVRARLFAVCCCHFSDSALAHAVPMCMRFANDLRIFSVRQWYFDTDV